MFTIARSLIWASKRTQLQRPDTDPRRRQLGPLWPDEPIGTRSDTP